MRPRPDAMRPRSRLRPERVWLRPNDLASRPHGPRGINTPGSLITKSRMPGLGKPVRDCDPYIYQLIEQVELQASLQCRQLQQGLVQVRVFTKGHAICSRAHSGKSGPKDQVALHYYYTSPSHWCTTHEVSKL